MFVRTIYILSSYPTGNTTDLTWEVTSFGERFNNGFKQLYNLSKAFHSFHST